MLKEVSAISGHHHSTVKHEESRSITVQLVGMDDPVEAPVVDVDPDDAPTGLQLPEPVPPTPPEPVLYGLSDLDHISEEDPPPAKDPANNEG